MAGRVSGPGGSSWYVTCFFGRGCRLASGVVSAHCVFFNQSHAPTHTLPTDPHPTGGGGHGAGVLSLKRPLTTRDKLPALFFILHLGGMAWILASPPSYTTTPNPTPSSSFSWPLALALAVVAGVGMAALVLRTLLYQPGPRRGLIRLGPLWAAGAQGLLALLLLLRLPWYVCMYVCPWVGWMGAGMPSLCRA